MNSKSALLSALVLVCIWATTFHESLGSNQCISQNVTPTLLGRSYNSYDEALTNPWNVGELHIPSNIAIGAEIRAFVNVESLEFSWHQGDSLPNELFQLSKLKSLHINVEQSFSLPKQIEQLTQLEDLTIMSTYPIESSAALPVELGKLKNLTSLSITTGKHFKFQFDIAGLVNLEEISVGGVLPKQIDRLTQLAKIQAYQIEKGCELNRLTNLHILKVALLDSSILQSPLTVEEFVLQPSDSSAEAEARVLPTALLNWEYLKNVSVDLFGNAAETSSSINILSRLPFLQELTFSQRIEDSSKIRIDRGSNYFSSLSELNICGTSSNYKIFHECSRVENLTIGINGNSFDKGAYAEDFTIGLYGIKIFSLQFLNPFPDQQMRSGMNYLSQLKHLKSLNITGMAISNSDSIFSWKWLRACSDLELLSFERCSNFNAPAVWKQISSLRKLKTLKSNYSTWDFCEGVVPSSNSIQTIEWRQNVCDADISWLKMTALKNIVTDNRDNTQFEPLRNQLDSITCITSGSEGLILDDQLNWFISMAPSKVILTSSNSENVIERFDIIKGYSSWLPLRTHHIIDSSDISNQFNVLVDWYPSGMKKQIRIYLNDSLAPFETREWFESGQIKSCTKFRYNDQNMMIEQESIAWYENGELHRFDHKIQSMPEGVQLDYYENGRLKHVSYYSNGQPSGKWQTWDKKGHASEKNYESRQ